MFNEKKINRLHRIYPLLFTVFGAYVLVCRFASFLEETAELTPFFTTADFWRECMLKPAGFLTYAGSLFTSFFLYPWMGAALFIGILLWLAFSVKRCFKVPDVWDGIVLVPSLMLLLNYTEQGYMIYLSKTPGEVFILPVGLCFTVWLAATYRRLKGGWMRNSLILLTAFAGYPLLGAYALAALLLYATVETASPTINRTLFSLTRSAAALLLILGTPYFFFGLYTRSSLSALYLAGLPDYSRTFPEALLWLPLSASMLLIIFLFASHRFKPNAKVAESLSATVFLFALICSFFFSYRDANFHSLLSMQKAVDRGEWKKVISIAGDTKEEPTRLQVLYTRLALQKTGQAGERMFTFPDGNASCRSPREYPYLRLMGAHSLYYYYGYVNFAYRWCMEDMVEYGKRPAYMKYMTLCALVNGEKVLAKKYIEALKHTLFYGSWAKKYEIYLDDLSLISGEREMNALRPLMSYESILDSDGGQTENYLTRSFALMEGGSRELVELSLQNNMLLKDIKAFWPRFFALLPTFKEKIPLHYQEAALLFSALEQEIDISRLPIERHVKQRFQALIEASQKNGNRGNEYNKKALASLYGDTYWFYYFFVNTPDIQ